MNEIEKIDSILSGVDDVELDMRLLASIAISLKRIADHLETIARLINAIRMCM